MDGAFLVVRHAYQTLLDPLKRNAYDLFGPTSAQWDLRTEREYLSRGVAWGVLPSYIVSFIALQVWGLFGGGGQVKFVTLNSCKVTLVAISHLPNVVCL